MEIDSKNLGTPNFGWGLMLAGRYKRVRFVVVISVEEILEAGAHVDIGFVVERTKDGGGAKRV